MSDKTDAEPLTVLRSRVDQASKLIGQLRETNYALTAELARLKHDLATRDQHDSRPDPTLTSVSEEDESVPQAAEVNAGGATQAQLELLLEERRQVREKVRGILGRLESLESSVSGEVG